MINKLRYIFIAIRHRLLILVGLFFLFTLSSSIFAQETVLTIKDKVSGEGIEFVHVSAKSLIGKQRSNTISDKTGIAKITLGPPFIVSLSCVGFKDYIDTLTQAGHHSILLSPEYYQLDNVVVTGQFRPQSVDRSIYKIDVMSSKEIQLKAANNLSELLRNEVGFQYRPEGVLGDFLRIRGLSGEYVKILIDGMPVTGRVAGRIDLGQFSLFNVDHVEIIEGPMSVVYGSNALAGAINVITRDYAQNDMYLTTNAYYETVGVYNFNLAASKRFGKHTFSINGARNYHNGWGPVDTSRYKIWKPKLQYLAGGAYQYRYKKFKFNIYSDYLYEELRDQGPLTIENLYEKAIDGYHYTTRWNNRMDAIHTFSEDFVVNFQGGYSYYKKQKNTFVNDLVNFEKTLSLDPDLHDTTLFHLITARGFVSNKSGSKFEYQTGFDYSAEIAEGKRTNGKQSIYDVAAFINIIYRPVSSLSLQPGLRTIYNSQFKAPVIYALNVKYQPGNFIFRTSYAKGFKAPSLKQLYLEFIDGNHEIYGNPNLQAEAADNISLSGDYRYSRGKHAIEAGIDLFYNSIENAIQLAVDTTRPGWGIYFNVEGSNYITKGMEATIKYHYFPRLSISAGMLRTGISRLDIPNKFEYSNDFVASTEYHSPRYDYEIALFYKYTDDFLEFAGNFSEEGELTGYSQRLIQGYNTIDLTIAKSFFDEQFRVSIGIRNLLDVTFVESAGNINVHGSDPGSTAVGYGRAFFLMLNYTFNQL